VKGWRILLVHGSPASNEEHLTPDTPKKRLRELAEMAKADVIICGHSHQPFVQDVDGVWFINTGSVGRSDDGDPRACYAVAQIDSKRLEVQHHRIEYDIDRTVAAIREHELPEAFAQMILQGRDLETVLEVAGA
jgi:putative phosphoesterase